MRSKQNIIEMIQSVKNWYHQIEIRPGIVTPGINNSAEVLKLLDLPEDCKGMRAIDLGTRDGFFAFELEKRGAEVIAVDYMPKDKTGFKVAAELLNSKVTYKQDNIYNLSKERYGEFDIVLFLGLLYHLPDPMKALNIVRTICKDELYLETHVIDNAFLLPDGNKISLSNISSKLEDIPIMQFFPRNSLNNDFTNYWGPNLKCMELMLMENNFLIIEKKLKGERAILKCKVGLDHILEYHRKISRGIIT